MKVTVLVGLYLVTVKATKFSIFLILEEKKCSTVASGEFVRCRHNSVRIIHHYRWIISTCGTQTSLFAKLDSYSYNVNLCETSFCWITFHKRILDFLVTLFSWLNLVSLKKGFCLLKPCVKHSQPEKQPTFRYQSWPILQFFMHSPVIVAESEILKRGSRLLVTSFSHSTSSWTFSSFLDDVCASSWSSSKEEPFNSIGFY